MRTYGLTVLLAAGSTHANVARRDNSTLVIEKRIVTEMSTCGYYNGDPSQARTADKGFNCRVDTSHGIWGFCPTTVISAVDCGLGAACIDSYACSNGCGSTDNPTLTTWTCSESTEAFCSTAMLEFGVDQTYAFIGCGRKATVDHYLVSPTAAAATTTLSPTRTTLPSSTTSVSESVTSSSSAAAAPVTTSPLPSTTAASTSTAHPLGPIIGGAIGGLVVICATTVLAIYLVKRDRSKKRESAVAPPEYSPKDPHVSTTRYSGWGPRELPAGEYPVQQARSPVELPIN